MSVLFQALCTGIICYLSTSMGIIFAWPSCTVTMFGSNQTSLHRPMGETELALFGSLSSIGALIGTPIAGYYLDVVGRKWCTVCASLSYVIGWGLIASFTQVEVILAAVFIAGFGASSMLIVRVYISEICQEKHRGAMTTASMVFYSLGLLLSYALGDFLDYKLMVYTCLANSVLGVTMIGLLKESPTFLMKKGLEKEAAKSIAFYRRISPDSKEVLQEMDTLRRAFNPDMEQEMLPEEEKLADEMVENRLAEKQSFWQFPLIIYSSIAAGVCCIILGTQLYSHWAPHWVTAVFLYLFTITYTFGAGTVPYVLVVDVFLPEIKSVMSMLVIQWSWLCSFIILFIFNPLVSAIGLGPIFFLFAGVCVFTVVYSIFCLPETKGLAVDAVQIILLKKIGKS